MDKCCVEIAREFAFQRFPSIYANDIMATRLVELCNKWGDLLNTLQDQFYIATTPSKKLGIGGQTMVVRCPECNKKTKIIIVGDSLFYFIWRFEMICATGWIVENSGHQTELMARNDWPKTEHLLQLKIAYSKYFDEANEIDAEGIAQLHQMIEIVRPEILRFSMNVVDLAELFILLHEINHHGLFSRPSESDEIADPPVFEGIEISPKRRRAWGVELNCDALAFVTLVVSATSVIEENEKMGLDKSKVKAIQLVSAGADTALQILELFEVKKYGVVNTQEAALGNIFKHHPPSKFRRNALSLKSFSMTTGKGEEALLNRDWNSQWQEVAQCVGSHMFVRQRLLDCYDKWVRTTERS